MSKIMFEIPTGTSSSADEIAQLEKLSDALQAAGGSYLASRINPQVVEWFRQNVKNDWNCDLYGELMFAKDNADNERKQAKIELDEAVENVRLVTKQADNLVGQLKLKDARIDELEDDVKEGLHQEQELRNELRDLRNDLQVKDLAIADMEQKILELKARLFDLLEE